MKRPWMAIAALCMACGGPDLDSATADELSEMELDLAADQPTQILRPAGNPTAQWQVGGSTAWNRLDEPVQQPAIPPGGDNVWAGGANRVLEVSFFDPTLFRGDPGRAVAWFYANTGTNTQLSVEVVWGGQPQAAFTLSSSTGFAWFPLSVNLTSREVADDLRLRFTTTGAGDANIRAAYVAVSGRDTPAFQVAVLGSAAKIRPSMAATGASRATLFAGKNEFEAFQVAINAGPNPIRGVTASMTGALAGPGGTTIPAQNVTLYREEYYNVRSASDLEGGSGRWPDALIPAVDPIYHETRNAFPFDVPARENRVLWVDVLVPPGAAAGVYTGNLHISSGAGSANVPVELRVSNFSMASTARLKTAVGFTAHECALGIANCDTDTSVRAFARQLFVRSALENRVTIAPAHVFKLTPGSSGLTQFRTYTLPYVRGTGASRLAGARLTTYQINRKKEFEDIQNWKQEATLQGFADRVFTYGCDEPYFHPTYGDPGGNWQLCLQDLRKFHALWPEAPLLVTTHIQGANDFGGSEGLNLTDVMVVNQELIDGRANTHFFAGNQRPRYDGYLANTSRAKQAWLYSACGSHGCVLNDDPSTRGWSGYEIDAPGAETRSMGWLAFHYGMSGVLYYDAANKLPTAWTDQAYSTGNGDGTLFYPGTVARIGGTHPVPVESIRLKLLRDGIEDYEMLHYIRAHGRSAEAHAIARQLFPATYDTARTDAQVQAARRQVATWVAAIAGGPAPH